MSIPSDVVVPDDQPSRSVGPADLLTALRIPLAFTFPLVESAGWRLVILAVAALSDFLDGIVARWYWTSRMGAVLDPIADKLFMVIAFMTLRASGQLTDWEILAVMSRDVAAFLGFLVVLALKRPMTIPARHLGKWATVAQLVTLLAWLVESSLLRPVAWITAVIAMSATVDYARVAWSRRAPRQPGIE
jgi:CDP-diacylglycerol---glycerol-3-phosphate 3-phosphatidyltransferase